MKNLYISSFAVFLCLASCGPSVEIDTEHVFPDHICNKRVCAYLAHQGKGTAEYLVAARGPLGPRNVRKRYCIAWKGVPITDAVDCFWDSGEAAEPEDTAPIGRGI